MTDRPFRYEAMNPAGRKVGGVLHAASREIAYGLLRQEGLSPLRIALQRGDRSQAERGRVSLGTRKLAELLYDISALTAAGAGLKPALSIIAEEGNDPKKAAAAKAIAAQVTAGTALDESFRRVLGAGGRFVPGLVAAGEASGKLPGALAQAAADLERELEFSEELGGALSYPAFVLAMALAALALILFLVVPALEPLAQEAAAPPPLGMALLFWTSRFLTENVLALLAGGTVMATAGVFGWRAGVFRATIEVLFLDGPTRGLARALTFGGFAATAGVLLSAGVAAPTALKLATDNARLSLAKQRLELVVRSVREGRKMSSALAGCRGMPSAIVRLASIGETSGSLGPMLERAGRFEQASAIRRIKRLAKWAGPVLIILLGAAIGSLMAGLLAGVAALGEAGAT